jgi:hypothetical protein
VGATARIRTRRKFAPILVVLAAIACVLVGAAVQAPAAGQASLTTDKSDYTPGEVVHISGKVGTRRLLHRLVERVTRCQLLGSQHRLLGLLRELGGVDHHPDRARAVLGCCSQRAKARKGARVAPDLAA